MFGSDVYDNLDNYFKKYKKGGVRPPLFKLLPTSYQRLMFFVAFRVLIFYTMQRCLYIKKVMSLYPAPISKKECWKPTLFFVLIFHPRYKPSVKKII